MTEEYPINSPPEKLVLKWDADWHHAKVKHLNYADYICTQAARWGANQELEACCEWLVANDWKAVHKHLRAARRPKPPSLKEQALKEVSIFEGMFSCDIDIIRRAIESLPD